MAYLQGFFDESGKSHKNKVVSFGGFVSEDWGSFEIAWRYRLRKHRIPYLHITKDALKARPSQLKMYSEFIYEIKRHIELGFVTAIDVDAYRTLPDDIRLLLGGDPHYLAFRSVLANINSYASSVPGTAVSIICDDDVETACTCYETFSRLRQKQPGYRETIKSISFADDKYYLPLQAADLYSWVARAEALHKFCGDSFPLRSLFTEFSNGDPDQRLLHSSGFWGRTQFIEFADGIRMEKMKKKNESGSV